MGDGPYLPELKNMANEYQLDVHFWGWLDNHSAELKELYERSSIFVFTSEAENFPIVLLEAMASGQAIITVNGTGCPEVVGDQALFVRPHDPAAVREALVRLMEEEQLRQSLSAGARDRIEREFAWHSIARKYTDVYQELIGTQAHSVAVG